MTRRSSLWRGVRLWVDPFVVAIVLALLIGVVVPVPDGARGVLDVVTDVAIALLFLLYGARLPTREIWRSLTDWRLQGPLLVATFVVFPLVGLGVSAAVGPVVGQGIAVGLLCVSLLPSTVNSAVAFTSVARGDVAGAICGATVSNVVGMVATPLLVLGLMSGAVAGDGAVGADGLQTVLLQLLAPLVLGQLLQPWVGGLVRRHKAVTTAVDRGTILLIVFTAISGATAEGIWADMTVGVVLVLVGSAGVLLAVMLALTWWGGRALGLPRDQRVTLLLVGGMKSLATGLPMASALLPAATLAVVVVPLVVFHQLQLVVCSVLARRLGQEPVPAEAGAGRG
ncbi:bile acid:sodium symporter family protein [Isoptericola sp. b515]|uniref:bile acid:sodium symporter family protein n=1 Tax=Isoptericola sp. b515 TaxID=3064652 RepID=UPI0027133F17|nr:bile acid:sodium symporter family protein [Isoptericola sp. b515]MDO8147708.1 bile acid:sodium symporter family protein [Isoptericola sp. b515]